MLPCAYAQELSNDELLNLIQKKSFNYFWHEANTENGLIPDRAYNFKAGTFSVASIAAVGFALTAYPIGVENGWITKNEAYDRTLKTLKFFKDDMENVHGFYYHFVDMKTGKRLWNCELSSIDTALFLAGALFSSEYFKGTEVEEIANEIYRRVDFSWMLNSGNALSMGWKPRSGFLKERWSHYDENMILYFLAISSPTMNVDPSVWKGIKRKVRTYKDYTLIASPPLFTHQYSHCWIDFRNKNDGFADYFENSRLATLANREFCIEQSNSYKTYSSKIWGLTASDGPSGYQAYGARPGKALHDGTVAPTAAISSIVFTPDLSIEFAQELYQNYKKLLWGRYGFSDSFNLEINWRSDYVLAIDLGPMLIMIQNYKDQFVWNNFMQLNFIQKALNLIGFSEGSIELEAQDFSATQMEISYGGKKKIDGDASDWKGVVGFSLDKETHLEFGTITDEKDLNLNYSFSWDWEFLYVYADVVDQNVLALESKENIHKDDLLELFIDPDGNGFEWGSKKDFQFGFAVSEFGDQPKTWLWPHGIRRLEKSRFKASVLKNQEGYIVEARIPWDLINVDPNLNKNFKLSLAVHDKDQDGTEAKLILFFDIDDEGRNQLGKVFLKPSN